MYVVEREGALAIRLVHPSLPLIIKQHYIYEINRKNRTCLVCVSYGRRSILSLCNCTYTIMKYLILKMIVTILALISQIVIFFIDWKIALCILFITWSSNLNK